MGGCISRRVQPRTAGESRAVQYKTCVLIQTQHDIRGRVSMVGRGADDNRSQVRLMYCGAFELLNEVCSSSSRTPRLHISITSTQCSAGKQLHVQQSIWLHNSRVIHGLDVLDVLERVPVLKKYRPTEEIVVERTTIHANPFAEKQLD